MTLWHTIIAVEGVCVAVGFVAFWLLSHSVNRRRNEMTEAIRRYKSNRLQRCPNCRHPFSEWFTHNGLMYCFLCSKNALKFGDRLFVSDYATHEEWREEDDARV